MAHARQTIREAVATAVTNLTTTTTNVFQSRVHQYASGDLPGLTVYTQSESLDEEAGILGTKEYRLLQCVIEARAKAAADIDDTLDTICAEVETALYADQTLSGNAKHLELKDTEITLTGDTDQEVGVARMTFEIQYRVDATDPTTIIA